MTLQDWSDIAQVVGNAAVLVTIIVLIAQIRTNTRTLERQMHVDRARALTEDILTSPDLVRASVKIEAATGEPYSLHTELVARYGLTWEEAWLISRQQLKMWTMYEAEFLFGGASARLARSIRAFWGGPQSRLTWDHIKRIRDPEFVRYVDRVLAAPPP